MDHLGAGFRLTAAGVHYQNVEALSRATLEIRPGEAVALVGPSGAGKTTLLRLLNGTIRPDTGTVSINERKLSGFAGKELRSLRASMAFVHQGLSLVPNLRVAQNVLAGRLGRMTLTRSLRSMVAPSRRELERLHAILERVGIEDKLFERTDRCSGGQQQRVAIARALYQDPLALLADEPVSSLDPARARDLVELLARISREEQITLVTSLHNLDLAREFFPRLVGMRGGRIEFDSSPKELDDGVFHALYDLTNEELMDA